MGFTYCKQHTLVSLIFLSHSFIFITSHIHRPNQGKRLFLIEAIEDMDTTIVNWLLKKEATVDVVDSFGATPLMRAAEKSDGLEIVKVLLEAGADVDLTDNETKMAMHYAAAGGSLDTVTLLQAKIMDPMNVDKFGETPVHKAAAQGHEAILAYLVPSVKDVESMFNKEGLTPVHIAAKYGQLQVLDYFKNESVDLNVRSFPGGVTPLIMASLNNQNDCVKHLLLKHDVEIGAVNSELRSALHFATINSNIDLVKFLISRNCSTDLMDTFGKTPLFLAFETGDYELAYLFMISGARTNVTDSEGNKLIHAAAQSGSLPLIKYLIREHVSINTVNNIQTTPLITASENGHLEVVKYLIKYGALIEWKNQRGYTCVHAAAQSGHKDVVELLVSKGGPLTDKTDEGMTPLHYASLRGRTQVVQFLIKSMANLMSMTIGIELREALHYQHYSGCIKCYRSIVNVQDNAGRTPLFLAAEEGQYETINVLTEFGANYQLKNFNGSTPFMVTASKDHVNVLRFIALLGVNMEETDNQGKSALHYSAEGGALSSLRFLIENQAYIEIKTSDKKTVMHIAAEEGHLTLVKELGVFPKLIDDRDSKGRTPAWYACFNGHLYVLKHLLNIGAKIDHSIVLAAVEGGDLNVVKHIIWNGGDTKVKNSSGHSLVEIAYDIGQPQLIAFLLDSGVSLQYGRAFSSKNTLLHLSSSSGKIQITKVLLTHGADMDVKDKDGNTPLYKATENQEIETVALLLDYGAMPNAENNQGESPVKKAIKSNKTMLIKCFFEHGKHINTLKENLKSMVHEALAANAIESFKYLVDTDNSVSKEKLIKDIAIHKVNSVEAFREIMKVGFDVNALDERGRGRLEQALREGTSFLVVQCLIKYGAQINQLTLSNIRIADGALRELVWKVIRGTVTTDQLEC